MISLITTDVGDMAARSIGALLETVTAGRVDSTTIAREHDATWRELVRNEWPMVGVPESRGGAGATLIDLAAVAEVWGRHLVALPFVPTALALRWAPEPSALAGRKLTYATPHRGGGAALFGGAPDVLVMRSPHEASPAAVERDGSVTDDFAPSCPYLLTSSASTLDARALREHAVLSAAQAVGCAATCLERSTAYASQRSQFGQPIGRFQAVRHRLADMHMSLEEARSALVWAANEPNEAGRGTSAAFDLCRGVIEGAIQVHGGIGFTWETPLHLHLRHVIVLARLSSSAL